MENWEISTGALLRSLGRRSWLIALAALTCGLLAVLAAVLMPPKYVAEPVFYTDNCGTDREITASDISASRALVDSCRGILDLEGFREAVAQAAGGPVELTGKAVHKTEFLRVTVTADSAEAAEQAAVAVGSLLPQWGNDILAGANIRLVDAPKQATQVRPPMALLGIAGAMLGALVSAVAVTAVEVRRLRREC